MLISCRVTQLDLDLHMMAGEVEKPILCLVRHLSPAGRFLSRSAFDFFMKSHPAAGEGRSEDDLLRVEIGKFIVEVWF